jgi:hypothetical protein
MSTLRITGPRSIVQHIALAADTSLTPVADDRAAVDVPLQVDLAVPLQTPMGEVVVGVSTTGPALTVEASRMVTRMINAVAKADTMIDLPSTSVLRWKAFPFAPRVFDLPLGRIELQVVPG